MTPPRGLDASLTETAQALAAGHADPVELFDAAWARHQQTEAYGAFISVDPDAAREAAQAARDRWSAGRPRSPLDGVPIALKDNLVTKGVRTTCGSRFTASWVPPYDGAASEALGGAGAVLFGKTNLDELGMGSSGEYSAFGPTSNPWDDRRVAGGSSSGSAAAVAMGVVFGALGSDTGGSVRLPAAFCGVWGLMPTYGRVSRHGLVAHASSLDRVGVLARSALDVALLLDLIAGPDDRDATCSTRLAPSHRVATTATGPRLRVGCIRPTPGDVATPVEDALETAVTSLRGLGHVLVDLPELSLTSALDAYYVLSSAEAASNLARFDGMRFGRRVEAGTFFDTVVASRDAGFGPEVKRRILLGTWVSSREQIDRVYARALESRAHVAGALARRLSEVDLLLTPVAASLPFAQGERTNDPDAMRATDRFTIPASLAGLPALSVPVRSRPLPTAVQLVGPAFSEGRLLSVAHELESRCAEQIGARVWSSRFE